MKRWEFDSIAQAARCMSSWFTGTPTERHNLKNYLNTLIGMHSLNDYSFICHVKESADVYMTLILAGISK